jgi:hypothetical protein
MTLADARSSREDRGIGQALAGAIGLRQDREGDLLVNLLMSAAVGDRVDVLRIGVGRFWELGLVKGSPPTIDALHPSARGRAAYRLTGRTRRSGWLASLFLDTLRSRATPTAPDVPQADWNQRIRGG